MSIENIYKKMGTSDFYKFAEGSNRMRIMTEFVAVYSKGQGQDYKLVTSEEGEADKECKMQAWAWAIIRAKNADQVDELAIIKCGKTILGQLVALKSNPEYASDKFPLPYDVDIQARGAGTKEVEYTTIGARKNTEVTEKEIESLNKKNSIEQIVAKIIEKKASFGDLEKKPEYPESTEKNNASAF